MSRLVPWRNKPTSLIVQMLPVAADMKLYLVNEIGPTSFLFKDEHDNKFKVVIGDRISCSCGVVQNDHCIHTLYVMLKKYRVPESHPIIWQGSYLDSELDGLIRHKYRQKSKQAIEKKTGFMRKKKKVEEEEEDFPPLQEDAICPICHEEDMGRDCYSTCETCHKSMHTKCLKVWVNHKQDHGSPVSCPMCRSKFTNPMIMIFKDLEKWEKRFSTHKGYNCKTCGMKNIQGLLYKCLICPHVHLCKMCYEGNQHGEHKKFFVKEVVNDDWKVAPIRVLKSRKQLFDPIPELNLRDLPSNIRSPDFIISLFPTVSEHSGEQNTNELNVIGNDMLSKQICHKCRTLGTQNMRRIFCGHSYHQECLRSMIHDKEYVCQVDNQPICPGYMNAIGIKMQKKKKAVDCTFIRAEEETKKIYDRLEKKGVSLGNGKQKAEKVRQNSVGKFHPKPPKDKNFRIMKKNTIERKLEIESLGVGIGFGNPMMITGLGTQQQIPSSGLGIHPQVQRVSRIPLPQHNI